MKVLFYSPHPGLNLSAPSGSGTHMREVISAMRELGCEVETLIMGGEVITQPTEGNFQTKTSIKARVRNLIPSIIWESIKDFRLLRKDRANRKLLSSKIQSFQPDLIYERGYYLMNSGAHMAKEFDIAHFLEMNAPFIIEQRQLVGKTLFNKYAEKIEKEQLTKADKTFVVTSALKKYFVDYYGINPNKIFVTPNAINPEYIINKSSSNNDIESHKLGFDEDDIVIGFIGSILPYHRVDRLLLAFSEAFKELENSKIRLLIVGGGERLEQLMDLAKELKINKFTVFTGNVLPENVGVYLELMDICVIPNANWYMSPIKLFEYAIAGKAIISIKSSAVSDVLEENVNCLLFENTEELTDRFVEITRNQNVVRELGMRAKTLVLDHHTWIQRGKFILNEYHNMKS